MKTVDASGNHHHALNPEAYGWVHATAFVTATTIYPYIHGHRLSKRDEARYYDEMLQLGAILRIRPDQLPATVAGYWDYYETMLAERLKPTEMAQAMLRTIGNTAVPLPPLVEQVTRPARRVFGRIGHLTLVAGLTPSARSKLGVQWTSRDERALNGAMSLIRPLHDRAPERAKYYPLAYHARAHGRSLDVIRNRARDNPPPRRTVPLTESPLIESRRHH